MAERAAIQRARERVTARRPRVHVEVVQVEGHKVDLRGGGHRDHEGWLLRLEDAFGTRGTAFALSQLNLLMAAAQNKGSIDGTRLDAMLAMVEAAAPRNEIEAALAVQMAVMHFATSQLITRAIHAEMVPQFEAAGSMAIKFARTFALQAETIAKLQRGGEQVVKVVHVHSGGQAIVGNVTTSADGASGPGGGGIDENRNQPHAKAIAATPPPPIMPPLRRQDEERQPVPVARGEG